jgi:LSD1 subclass zinc finger protein
MEQAELQPTRPENAFVKTFPCTGCGAKLSFAPGTRELKCEYCGATNAISENDSRVEELDFGVYLRALEGKMEVQEVEEVRCDKCGAEQPMAGNLFAGHCTFCGAAIVSKSYASRRIKPKSIVPFQLDRAGAQESFRRWLRWRWLAPGDLKRYAQSDATLSGVYLPFWTYDCQTSTDYTGQRGVKRDKSTSWTSVSGHVDRFHDDVVVVASRSLPPSLQGAISRWDTKALVPYQPEFVSGFQAEAYQIGLSDGYQVARSMIDERIRHLIRRDIGGDQQRIDSVRTQYSDVTFKHVLLPVWISAYRYRDKVYRFLVNAQTGETTGESPLSWWKVALLVTVVLVLFYFWLTSQ